MYLLVAFEYFISLKSTSRSVIFQISLGRHLFDHRILTKRSPRALLNCSALLNGSDYTIWECDRKLVLVSEEVIYPCSKQCLVRTDFGLLKVPPHFECSDESGLRWSFCFFACLVRAPYWAQCLLPKNLKKVILSDIILTCRLVNVTKNYVETWWSGWELSLPHPEGLSSSLGMSLVKEYCFISRNSWDWLARKLAFSKNSDE